MIITFIMAAMNDCKKYIKTWQMEPIGIAQAAALTPSDVEIKFIDDRVEDIDYDVPIFEIENMNAHKEAIEAEEIDYPYPNNMIRKNAETYYGTYFEGSLHMDYTDLPMFSPLLGKMLGSGDVDNAYVMDTVNSLAADFFDCYLKGEGQFSVNESYPGVR